MNIKEVTEKLKEEKKKLTNLLPEYLQKDFERDSFVGGGCVYSLYNDDEPKDYDFFLEKQETVDKVRLYFSMNSTLKLRGSIKIGKYKGLQLLVTDNAISIGNYQIITRWVGEPKEVIGEFDFKHNMFYLKDEKVETLVKWSYLDDNYLRFNDDRARDICGCIIRTKKFIERGFTMTNKEMSKMLLKLHEVGFNDRELEILNYHDERINFGS